jgi:G3E family GTPase
MNKKVQIILLSGFLGAGKTTLLKQIMSFKADMSDTVIIMNEIGEVGIDGMLINSVGGKTERTPWKDFSETRLACVGWNIDPDQFLEKLKACVRR